MHIVLKSVELADNMVLIYDLHCNDRVGVYNYTEYILENGRMVIYNRCNIDSYSDIECSLNDLCSHYGDLDTIRYR